MSKKIVIDVASYQSGMSVASYKATGAEVAIIKLTESTNYINPYIASQIDKCRQAGIKHIHFYHFQRGTSTSQLKAEAQFCVRVAKQYGYKGSYIFLDAELTGAVPTTEAIKAFYKIVRDAGYKAGFYTYKFMYPRFHPSVFTTSDGVWAAAYPLGDKATSSHPNMGYFPSVANCLAWQFTDNWKGMHIDGSITLDNRLLGGSSQQEKTASYYKGILKRIRLKQTTKIYKDKHLKTAVRSYGEGEEFEIIPQKPYITKSGATRYQTESGFYITGNMDYVDSLYYLGMNYNQSHLIELKRTAKLYNDKSFKQVVREYPKGTQFKVVENVALDNGRHCFKVQSGHYITANKDYVKFV